MIKMALRKLLGTLAAIVLATGLAAGCGKADTAPKEAQSPTAEEESVDAGAEEAEAKGGMTPATSLTPTWRNTVWRGT